MILIALLSGHPTHQQAALWMDHSINQLMLLNISLNFHSHLSPIILLLILLFFLAVGDLGATLIKDKINIKEMEEEIGGGSLITWDKQLEWSTRGSHHCWH
jgi:hypothetical protein